MTQVKMPDPVAYRYRVIDDEWEYSEQSFFADGGSPGDQEESDSLITTTQAEAYADSARREALEEAAAMVDSCHPKANHRGIATAIRALIPHK